MVYAVLQPAGFPMGLAMPLFRAHATGLTGYQLVLAVAFPDAFSAPLAGGAIWDDTARRYFIEQGLELGAYAFDRLYRELHAACG